MDFEDQRMMSWSNIPYPGEYCPPKGIDPMASTWPMNYFMMDEAGNIFTLDGRLAYLDILPAQHFDFYKELAYVEEMQRVVTPEQINIAHYWGTGVPVQQITPIALTLIDTYRISPPKSARIMDCLHKVINDAFVITWRYKYGYNVARPCQMNRELKTVLKTPIFPAYPSGHSVVSAAAMTVLGFFFPAEKQKLDYLAEEASMSRLYGGIHFNCDLKEGVKLGRSIGYTAVEHFSKQQDGYNQLIDQPIRQGLNAPIYPWQLYGKAASCSGK